jgi:glycosyltransferase involved in cell wall biosynthesis
MKILMVDKYYFIKGGAERYLFELTEVLQANGHTVIPFAMQHPENFATEYEDDFVDNVDYAIDSFWKKAASFLRITGRMIYSLQARERLDRLIARERPEVAHLHMIDHQLSPSILHALKKYKIPVIQTVHQYKLICPNYRLYNPRTAKICEKCLDGNFYHPIIERCHKDSALAGLLIAVESYVHRWMKIYEKNIDVFHVPSRFMSDKMRQAGIAAGKIRHLPYTIKIDKFTPHFKSRPYALYFGRLSDEKGILTLLRAMKSAADIPLYVVGDGPQEGELKSFVNLKHMKNVSFLGKKSGESLARFVQEARFIVVPSEWYDNSPLVIYESMAYGKPVIAARLGGMPELIIEGETGLLFDAGNTDQLAEKIRFLWDRPALAEQFGRAARAKAEQEFDPAAHYDVVHGWYRELLQHGVAERAEKRGVEESL